MSTWASKITTSLRGRRLGLQIMTTGESGGAATRGSREFLVGPEGFRQAHSTANTTGVNLPAYGVQVCPTAGVYTIDPPIPGVQVTVVGSSGGVVYVKTNGGETIMSSGKSSDSVITIPSAGGAVNLTGITTARWAIVASTGHTLSTST